VDSTTDIITEYVKEGTDTVQSSVSFTLANNLENLTSRVVKGNPLNNIIVGNAAKNSLKGDDDLSSKSMTS